MNDSTIAGIGPACAALAATALFVCAPAADAAETVHMPMQGQTQGAERRPDVQPDPIGKSARPDDAPGRAQSREPRRRGRVRDGAPEAGPAKAGIEHEDIGSAARMKAGAASKARKSPTEPGADATDQRLPAGAQKDAAPGARSVTDPARADGDEVNRR